MQKSSSKPFGIVMMHVLGFLACLAVLRVVVQWEMLSPHGRLIGLAAVVPAYFFFVRDIRHLDVRSFAHIFLWAGILFICGAIRSGMLGFILFTNSPVSSAYFYNVFGFGALCFVGSGICFWLCYRHK